MSFFFLFKQLFIFSWNINELGTFPKKQAKKYKYIGTYIYHKAKKKNHKKEKKYIKKYKKKILHAGHAESLNVSGIA